MKFALTIGITGSLLCSCASVSTRLPDITLPELNVEQAEQENLAFTEIARLQSRLSRVSQPILIQNTALCPRTAYNAGVKTHWLKSYPKAVRLAAARELGATNTPKIFHILPGSPADKAGLKPDDILINDKGEPVKTLTAAYESEVNDAGEAIGRGRVHIRREGKDLALPITPDTACDYNVRLSTSTAINAYADGRNITITSGMMNFVQTDEELALIVGHEMGHNTMGHIRKIIGNLLISGLATRYTRPFESEADYVGLYYMVRAGYNPDNVENVWRRLGAVNPKSVVRAKTHPTYPDRYLRLAAAREEIRVKTATGEPLIPNFLSDGGSSDNEPDDENER